MIDHHHYSAQAIALLFEQSGHHMAEFRDSLERCPTCSLALQEYSNWLVALEHTNPLVALEYCTRHRLFETLSRKSVAERWELVLEDSLFHRWGLALLLLELILRERAKAYTSNVFKHAMLEGLIEMNPTTAVQRMTREKPRARQYSDQEISRLWNLWRDPVRSEKQSLATPEFFCLALLTLARRQDLLHMEWKYITETDDGWVWSIPTEIKMPDGSRMELIKNGIQHRVPLSSLASEILWERICPLTKGQRWVFPAFRKVGWPQSGGTIQAAKDRYQKLAQMEDFRVHDLKSVAATLLARLKVEEKIISYLCNHKPRNITAKVYIREQERYFEERAEALEMLAQYVLQIADGRTEGRILPFSI